MPEELVSPSQDAFALDLALPAHVEAVCRRLSRERSEAQDEAQAAYEVVVKGKRGTPLEEVTWRFLR